MPIFGEFALAIKAIEKVPDFIIVIAIFIIAIIVRILFIQQITHSPLTYFSIDDEYYNVWALEISKGNIIGKEIFYGLPFYPYLLGLIYFLFGHSILIARIFQIVLGSVSCVLLYFIGKKVFDKTSIKYKEGVSSSLDLTQINNQYLQTQTNYIAALVELLNAKIRLDKSLNQL